MSEVYNKYSLIQVGKYSHEIFFNIVISSLLKFVFYCCLSDSNLIGVAANTYLAGTDTTSQALYWIFLYLVLYPDVQEEIYTEITHSIG